jgi:hypothetical protein
LQAEYDEAVRQDGPGRAWVVWIGGHAALFRALVWHAGVEAVGLIVRPSDDRRMFARLVLITAILAIAGTAGVDAGTLALLAKLNGVEVSVPLAMTFAAQVLPIALPIAVALAALWARARDGVSRWRTIVLCLSVAASIVSFVMVGWIAPAVTRTFWAPTTFVADVAPPPMLTLGELRARVALEAADRGPYALVTALNYNLRWSLSAAPVALGAFVIALTSGRRRVWLATLGTVVALAYLVVLVGSLRLGVLSALPVPIAAWAPNVLFLLAAALTMAALRRRLGATDLQAPRWT